jgi:hypothetical protein
MADDRSPLYRAACVTFLYLAMMACSALVLLAIAYFW